MSGRMGHDEEIDRRLVSRRRRRSRGTAIAPLLDTGWVDLVTISNDAAIGTLAWTSPENARTSNDVYTNALALSAPITTNYLKGLDLSSGVPAGATILGVQIRIERRTSDPGVTDSVVSLVKGGTVQGDNKAAGVDWPIGTSGTGADDAYAIYGSDSDLWGLTLTAADVNAADFGLVLSAAIATAFRNALVDNVQMKVFYRG